MSTTELSMEDGLTLPYHALNYRAMEALLHPTESVILIGAMLLEQVISFARKIARHPWHHRGMAELF